MVDEISKHVLKTGTLTVGLVCKEGIVLAADNRVTYGGEGGVRYIAGKENKIVKLGDKMLVTTAGVASDAEKTLRLISAEVRLKELRTSSDLALSEVANLISNVLFQNIRTPSIIPSIAHFLLAGYDSKGASLFDLSPDGHLKEISTYAATGAPFQAHAILDTYYKKNMTLQEGIDLAQKTFEATAGREPGVGDGWDVYTIKKGKIEKVVSKNAILKLENKDNSNQ
jgi:proteasome beta subunit